jgi:putative aldouronate transport system permease protein
VTPEPGTPETNKQPKHLRPWERRVTLGGVLIMLVLVLVLVVTGYPFFYIFFLAVMPYDAFVRQSVHLLPAGFTLEYFGQILSDSRLVAAFGVSIFKTVLGTALSVLVTTLAGYALSRPQLGGRKFLTFLFLVPLFVSGGLIPFFLVIRALGLLNTFWALVLPGVVSSFNFFIVRAYFQDYPQEVIEAATLDGASPFAVFWRIVWPTSTPIIATIALLYGIGHWNDYFWPSILVQPQLYPAQVVLQQMVENRNTLAQMAAAGSQGASQSFIAAMAAVMIVPVLILYPWLQRYVIKGIMIGSTKG